MRQRSVRARLVAGVVAGVVLLGGALLFLRRGPSVQAPPPDVATEEAPPPPVPPSTLTVPIVADLSSVLEDLELIIPRSRGSLDDRIQVEDNDRLEVAFRLWRAPLQAELRGDVAHVRSIIEYRARVWYDPPFLPTISASCASDPDEPAPRAVVELTSQLWLTSEWELDSQPRVARVAPVSDTDRDRCRLTVFDFDVTDRVMAGARGLIEEKAPDLRAALHGVDVRSRFEEWWDILSEPIELDDGVWLVLDPEGVAQGETSGSALVLTANTTLTARPRLVLGPRPSTPRRPLPPLDTTSVPSGLTIRAVAQAEYAAASQLLNDRLAGASLEVSGHLLRIDHLALSGVGGGRIALEVEVGGSVRGRVFLVGTPQHDPVADEIFVPDLDFDVATANLLVGSIDWVAHEELSGFLRERARWPAGNLTELAFRYLEQGLNSRLSDRVRLVGRVDSVAIRGVHATRDALEIHADASGEATLVVERD
jgi:hypothetical protein